MSFSDALRPTPPSPAVRPGAGPSTRDGNTARGKAKRRRRDAPKEDGSGERAPDAEAPPPPDPAEPGHVDIRV